MSVGALYTHARFVRRSKSGESSPEDVSTTVTAVPVDVLNSADLSSSDSSLMQRVCEWGAGGNFYCALCTQHTWESMDDSGFGCANVRGKSGCTKSGYTRYICIMCGSCESSIHYYTHADGTYLRWRHYCHLGVVGRFVRWSDCDHHRRSCETNKAS